MSYYDEIREVTETVQNPELDKRKRYGPEAIHEIKPGYRFFVYADRDKMLQLRSVDDVRLGYVHRSGANLGRLLMDNSKVTQPKTVKEAVAIELGSGRDHLLAEILERLVARGSVSMLTVINLAKAIEEEDA